MATNSNYKSSEDLKFTLSPLFSKLKSFASNSETVKIIKSVLSDMNHAFTDNRESSKACGLLIIMCHKLQKKLEKKLMAFPNNDDIYTIFASSLLPAVYHTNSNDADFMEAHFVGFLLQQLQSLHQECATSKHNSDDNKFRVKLAEDTRRLLKQPIVTSNIPKIRARLVLLFQKYFTNTDVINRTVKEAAIGPEAPVQFVATVLMTFCLCPLGSNRSTMIVDTHANSCIPTPYMTNANATRFLDQRQLGNDRFTKFSESLTQSASASDASNTKKKSVKQPSNDAFSSSTSRNAGNANQDDVNQDGSMSTNQSTAYVKQGSEVTAEDVLTSLDNRKLKPDLACFQKHAPQRRKSGFHPIYNAQYLIFSVECKAGAMDHQKSIKQVCDTHVAALQPYMQPFRQEMYSLLMDCLNLYVVKTSRKAASSEFNFEYARFSLDSSSAHVVFVGFCLCDPSLLGYVPPIETNCHILAPISHLNPGASSYFVGAGLVGCNPKLRIANVPSASTSTDVADADAVNLAAKHELLTMNFADAVSAASLAVSNVAEAEPTNVEPIFSVTTKPLASPSVVFENPTPVPIQSSSTYSSYVEVAIKIGLFNERINGLENQSSWHENIDQLPRWFDDLETKYVEGGPFVSLVADFITEIKVLRALNSRGDCPLCSNLPQLFGFGYHYGYTLFCVTLGLPLKTYIDMKFPWTQDFTDGLASAVGFIHSRGFVHCDIGPHNIIVVTEGGTSASRPMLIDFGFAKLLTQDTKFAIKAPHCGAREFLSPYLCKKLHEQRNKKYNKRFIVYSVTDDITSLWMTLLWIALPDEAYSRPFYHEMSERWQFVFEHWQSVHDRLNKKCLSSILSQHNNAVVEGFLKSWLENSNETRQGLCVVEITLFT